MEQCSAWRIFARIASCALLALTTFAAAGQSAYPHRLIHLVVPYPPGGNAPDFDL